MSSRSRINVLVLSILCLLYGILLTHKINLVTADLGRHLKNGELILQGVALEDQNTRKVLTTNFYSYSNSEYPFINHHWGSGVVFYLIHKFFGFAGLSIFFTILSLATFIFFFLIAERSSSAEVAGVVSLFIIPVLASRLEIRPETFSYFFCGIFFYLLWSVRENKLSKKCLLFLPVLEILWINLHIYFFLGLFLIGAFLGEEVIGFFRKGKFLSNLSDLSYLGGILFLTGIACLVNPAGIEGVLYPLKIFNNFGYRLLENQSVLFLDKLIHYPPDLYFKIVFGLLAASWIFALIRRQSVSIVNVIFTLFFSYLGWSAVRNFAIFGLFSLPIIAGNFNIKTKIQPEIRFFIWSSLVSLIVLGLFLLNSSYWVGHLSLGVGLDKKVERAANFFKKEGISGPIFNNYDNGGYLIYYLFPEEKVFADNRPEAYPKEFFSDIYIPMQEQEDKWDQVDQKYNFNAIFFYRNDLTPWSQTFLINRISDQSWAPVYVDDYSIIFLKRNKENEALIKQFELPKNMFSIKSQ